MTSLFILLCVRALMACNSRRTGKFSPSATLPLRGIMAIGIVLHHVALRVDAATPDSPWWLSQFCSWGAPIVSVFFFMSGYGLLVSLKSKGTLYLDGFLKKRLSKVVLPLVLCSVVYMTTAAQIIGGGYTTH